jgi:hypothetical protein
LAGKAWQGQTLLHIVKFHKLRTKKSFITFQAGCRYSVEEQNWTFGGEKEEEERKKFFRIFKSKRDPRHKSSERMEKKF